MGYKNQDEAKVYYKEYYKKNKNKIKVYQKKYSKKNKEKIIIRRKKWAKANKDVIYANVRKRKNKNYKLIRKIKLDSGCEICGYNKHHVALDFDHLDRKTKITSVGQMVNFSWKRIQKEINKCRILCANCHRIETYKQIKVD